MLHINPGQGAFSNLNNGLHPLHNFRDFYALSGFSAAAIDGYAHYTQCVSPPTIPPPVPSKHNSILTPPRYVFLVLDDNGTLLMYIRQ